MLLVNAAIIGHILLTSMMYSKSTMFMDTHESLLIETVNEGTTVVAKGEPLEGMLLEGMRDVHAKPLTAGRG